MNRTALGLAAAAVLAACATNPSGRTYFAAVSDREMNQMGQAAFEQMKGKDTLSTDPRLNRTAQCIVQALVAELPQEWRGLPWEVRVFEDDSPNAFALPGGKMGINTGMFRAAPRQEQIAAVLGHEIGHVVYRHGAERVTQTGLAQVGMGLVGAYAGGRTSPENTRTLMAALGAGVQVGALLPFSRAHESEADAYGQALMARAGFDPQGAVDLWQAMQQAGGTRPITLLSTHPDPANRMRALNDRVPELRRVQADANATGRRPNCA